MTTSTAAITTTTTTMTTEAPTVAEETVVLITGGRGSMYLSSSEIYPTGCSLPDLPSERYLHSTFVTTGPSPKIVTCGRSTRPTRPSCLVLNVENQLWEENVVGKLPRSKLPRRSAASVSRVNRMVGGTSITSGYGATLRRQHFPAQFPDNQWERYP